MLREETLKQTDRRTYEEPDGEFLEMIDSGSNTITVLTRVDSDKVGGVEAPFEPEGYSVSGLRGELQDRDLTEEELQALLEAEEDGKGRTTAFSAIESQQ
jgi:hypothetical protein